MRKNQSSLTAAGIALARAVEYEKPIDERICSDPYARKLIPAWMYYILGFLIRKGYTEMRGPGVNGFLLARERYLDDVLQSYLDQGLQQLVILGAGSDSRAYRFILPDGLKIFEVDHPATQAGKLVKLKTILADIPKNINFVTIDFNTQTLEGRLLESGFDPKLQTLYIWQGVSMYLTAEAVDKTLAFVVNQSAMGSAIVFDYIYQGALQNTQKHNEIKNMYRYRFITGEGLTFGISEGEIEKFLIARGFRLVKDVDVHFLKSAYFTGKKATRKIAAGYGIAIGIV